MQNVTNKTLLSVADNTQFGKTIFDSIPKRQFLRVDIITYLSI